MPERLLTDAWLRSVVPDAKRDKRTSDGGGLQVRVLKSSDPKNKKIQFVYRYKLPAQDKTEYFPCGTYPITTLAEARKRHAAARKLVDAGESPLQNLRDQREAKRLRAEAEAKEKTVNGLFEEWERIHLKRHRKDGGSSVRKFLQTDILDKIGKQKARSVTKRQIVLLLHEIVDRGARRKANIVFTTVRQMFGYAMRVGIIDADADPTKGLTKKDVGGEELSRDRQLSADEIAELAKLLPSSGLPERAQIAVWLLLATGARVGELLAAQWTDFDLKARIWTIPETKNGKAHVIHLSEFATKWLKRLATLGKTKFLFEGREAETPVSDKWLGKMLRDRQRMTPLKNRTQKTGTLILPGKEWRAHDLRRTMASRMQGLKVPPHVVEKCLNHSLEGILAVYQRDELLDERKNAFDTWGQYLERLINPVPNVLEFKTNAAANS